MNGDGIKEKKILFCDVVSSEINQNSYLRSELFTKVQMKCMKYNFT